MTKISAPIRGITTHHWMCNENGCVTGCPLENKEGEAMSDTKQDTVWKAVKAALKTYAEEYPKTWAGKFINRVWGAP